jgi:hypothetical protein
VFSDANSEAVYCGTRVPRASCSPSRCRVDGDLVLGLHHGAMSFVGGTRRDSARLTDENNIGPDTGAPMWLRTRYKGSAGWFYLFATAIR